MIEGVEIKRIKRHVDDRGYFEEILRVDDPIFTQFGQWSLSKMATGVIKAWHVHKAQADYWFVPVGVVRAVLYDMREDTVTAGDINEFIMGDDQEPIVLRIPPGVAHGCKVLQGPAMLSYVTTHVYNPEDEGRLAYNDKVIGYDWITEVIK